MSRLQLALRVSDLDTAVPYYEALFASPVTKRRPGYANFVVADPSLKLVLLETPDGAGGLDHLGVETLDAEEQATFHARLDAAGLTARTEEATECCYAVQDKAWTVDPDGLPWEVYRVLDEGSSLSPTVADACCVEEGRDTTTASCACTT